MPKFDISESKDETEIISEVKFLPPVISIFNSSFGKEEKLSLTLTSSLIDVYKAEKNKNGKKKRELREAETAATLNGLTINNKDCDDASSSSCSSGTTYHKRAACKNYDNVSEREIVCGSDNKQILSNNAEPSLSIRGSQDASVSGSLSRSDDISSTVPLPSIRIAESIFESSKPSVDQPAEPILSLINNDPHPAGQRRNIAARTSKVTQSKSSLLKKGKAKSSSATKRKASAAPRISKYRIAIQRTDEEISHFLRTLGVPLEPEDLEPCKRLRLRKQPVPDSTDQLPLGNVSNELPANSFRNGFLTEALDHEECSNSTEAESTVLRPGLQSPTKSDENESPSVYFVTAKDPPVEIDQPVFPSIMREFPETASPPKPIIPDRIVSVQHEGNYEDEVKVHTADVSAPCAENKSAYMTWRGLNYRVEPIDESATVGVPEETLKFITVGIENVIETPGEIRGKQTEGVWTEVDVAPQLPESTGIPSEHKSSVEYTKCDTGKDLSKVSDVDENIDDNTNLEEIISANEDENACQNAEISNPSLEKCTDEQQKYGLTDLSTSFPRISVNGSNQKLKSQEMNHLGNVEELDVSTRTSSLDVPLLNSECGLILSESEKSGGLTSQLSQQFGVNIVVCKEEFSCTIQIQSGTPDNRKLAQQNIIYWLECAAANEKYEMLLKKENYSVLNGFTNLRKHNLENKRPDIVVKPNVEVDDISDSTSSCHLNGVQITKQLNTTYKTTGGRFREHRSYYRRGQSNYIIPYQNRWKNPNIWIHPPEYPAFFHQPEYMQNQQIPPQRSTDFACSAAFSPMRRVSNNSGGRFVNNLSKEGNQQIHPPRPTDFASDPAFSPIRRFMNNSRGRRFANNLSKEGNQQIHPPRPTDFVSSPAFSPIRRFMNNSGGRRFANNLTMVDNRQIPPSRWTDFACSAAFSPIRRVSNNNGGKRFLNIKNKICQQLDHRG